VSEMNPFWMVYGLGQGQPTWKHSSAHAATKEAERLARLHPGKTFIVLEAIGAVRKRDIEIIPIGRGTQADLDDDIPF
jgi:hypothetical protein